MQVNGKPQHQNTVTSSDEDREIILVADDEEIVRESTKTMLEFSGYKVIVARDGVEAVEKFHEARGKISCVLLDLRMPEKNGEETLQEIRETDDDIPVVLVSAYCDEVTVKRLAQSGISGVVPKPYRYEDLTAILDEVLL